MLQCTTRYRTALPVIWLPMALQGLAGWSMQWCNDVTVALAGSGPDLPVPALWCRTTVRHTALHHTVLHCTALGCAALHGAVLLDDAMHCAPPHYETKMAWLVMVIIAFPPRPRGLRAGRFLPAQPG